MLNMEKGPKSLVPSKSTVKNEVSSTVQGKSQRPQSLLPKTISAPVKEPIAVQRPVNRVERYSSTLEANLSHDQHTELTPTDDMRLADAITNKSKTISPIGRNPFKQDDEEYPRTNNPFENDDDADDYDRNLNPFAS